VVSMTGILVGTAEKMYEVQERGAERVAQTAKEMGVGRMVMLSAIGSDSFGATP